MQFLRKATASQIVSFGPFIDDTDFKTPKTGLTIANTDIKIVQAGAATSKNSGGGTHRAGGVYEATFDATDTAVVGRAQIIITGVSAALPVTKEVTILEAAVYDAMFASGADLLEVLGVIASGTAGNVTSGGTSIVLTGVDFSADTNIVGATVKLRATGTGKGQTRGITAWVNSTATATVDRAWTSAATAPTYDLYAGPPAPTTAPDVNVASTSGLGTGFPLATNAIGYGTVTTGATTTSVPTSAMSPAGAIANQFAGRTMVFTNTTNTTTLRGAQAAISASSNSATPTFTVAALPAAPASGDSFVVV